MSVLYSDIYEDFINRIIKDISFFDYYGKTADEAMELVKYQIKNYLREAVIRVKRFCKLVDGLELKLNNLTEELEGDLTDVEIDMIIGFMYEIHMNRYKIKLKSIDEQFVPKDLTNSPISQNRSTYMNMLSDIENSNLLIIDAYNSTDRKTNKEKIIDYESYDV